MNKKLSAINNSYSFIDQKHSIFEYLIFVTINNLFHTRLSLDNNPTLYKKLLLAPNEKIDIYDYSYNIRIHLEIETSPGHISLTIPKNSPDSSILQTILREIKDHLYLFLNANDTHKLTTNSLHINFSLKYTTTQKSAFFELHKQAHPQKAIESETKKKKIKIKKKKPKINP